MYYFVIKLGEYVDFTRPPIHASRFVSIVSRVRNKYRKKCRYEIDKTIVNFDSIFTSVIFDGIQRPSYGFHTRGETRKFRHFRTRGYGKL